MRSSKDYKSLLMNIFNFLILFFYIDSLAMKFINKLELLSILCRLFVYMHVFTLQTLLIDTIIFFIKFS